MATLRHWRIGQLTALLAALLVMPPPTAVAGEVDLELLLAVDVSASVDPREYALQMQGLARAFRDDQVIAAIEASGPDGIVVAMLQWAGPNDQELSVPWSSIRDRASAEVFAAKIEAAARSSSYGATAIGAALGKGIELIVDNDFSGLRRVIDISGDGQANIGDSPDEERKQAVELGITINGLAIDQHFLSVYYQYRVIAGPDAFVMKASGFEDFAEAIRLKLIREIRVSALP